MEIGSGNFYHNGKVTECLQFCVLENEKKILEKSEISRKNVVRQTNWNHD